MEIPILTFEEIEKYLQKNKIRGTAVIETIAKYNHELTIVLGNEIGREILKTDLSRVDDLFTKIYKEEITPNSPEMAEFRYLRDTRIPYIINKISIYLELLKKVKAETKK